jgi:hypothetical protein
MSAAAARDSFVPFEPVPAEGVGAPSASGGLKVAPKAEAAAAFTPLAAPASALTAAGSAVHGKPVVTLQRDAERVTGIRIECVCGQIIELACSY